MWIITPGLVCIINAESDIPLFCALSQLCLLAFPPAPASPPSPVPSPPASPALPSPSSARPVASSWSSSLPSHPAAAAWTARASPPVWFSVDHQVREWRCDSESGTDILVCCCWGAVRLAAPSQPRGSEESDPGRGTVAQGCRSICLATGVKMKIQYHPLKTLMGRLIQLCLWSKSMKLQQAAKATASCNFIFLLTATTTWTSPQCDFSIYSLWRLPIYCSYD